MKNDVEPQKVCSHVCFEKKKPIVRAYTIDTHIITTKPTCKELGVVWQSMNNRLIVHGLPMLVMMLVNRKGSKVYSEESKMSRPKIKNGSLTYMCCTDFGVRMPCVGADAGQVD